MENAGSMGNTGNTGNVRLTNNDEEKYQMVPVPPGLLQYYVKKETIISMREDIKSLKARCTDYKKNYELECHTKENLLRLIPNTPMGLKHKDVWKILLVIKSVSGGTGGTGRGLRSPGGPLRRNAVQVPRLWPKLKPQLL